MPGARQHKLMSGQAVEGIEQGQRSGRFRVMDRRTAVAGILAVVNAAADLRSSGVDEASIQAWALRVCLRILTSP